MMHGKTTSVAVLGVLTIVALVAIAPPAWAQRWAQDPLQPLWVREKALLARPQHPEPKPIAIRAGNLFDPNSGTLKPNQVVLILGERITEVGPASQVKIPAGAAVIDLSRATVLPGLIDSHLHVSESGFDFPDGKPHPRPSVKGFPTTQAEFNRYFAWGLIELVDALKDLNAGFTTIVDLGATGSAYATIAVRDAINEGMIPGPRMLVAGPMISDINPNITTPEQARAAVRELAAHKVDWIKVGSTGAYTMKPDGTSTVEVGGVKNLESQKAIVDEATKLGLRVACHAYGGDGLTWCIESGAYPQHGTFLTDAQAKLLLQKNMSLAPTLFDHRVGEPVDLAKFGTTRYRNLEQSVKKAMAAGVKISFASGAQTEHTGFPHGSQTEMFAVFVKWGMTPAQALRTATTINADVIGWQDRAGTIDKGKFADIIAVSGDPLKDITEMDRVRFVMKGGMVVKNDLQPPAPKAAN